MNQPESSDKSADAATRLPVQWSESTQFAVPMPPDEPERVAALDRYGILDTPPEKSFDDLAVLAAQICGAPISLVSFVAPHRQWFKARVGMEAAETSRNIAFCAHAIMGRDVFIVPDALADPRFANNPMVTSAPNVRFYAGAPLITPDGRAIGTICVFDRVPRVLTEEQKEALRALSRQAMFQMELRRTVDELQRTSNALRVSEERFRNAFEFAGTGMCLVGSNGKFLRVNPAYERLTGYSEAELQGKTFRDITHPDDLDADLVEMRRMLAGEVATYEKKKRYIAKDGHAIWIRLNVSLVRDAAGQPLHFMSQVQDITAVAGRA